MQLQKHNRTLEPAENARWLATGEAQSELHSLADPFAEAVNPYIPKMLRAARGILGSDDQAWDAVQETLTRIWVRGWIPDQPERALVHLTVKSSLHQLRCLRRRSHHEDKGAEMRETCCHEDPLAMLESVEQAEIVRKAVGRLTDEYRSVLELYAFEGKSYEGIAAQLSLPIGTVRSRLSRGRALLLEGLAGYFTAA